MKRRNGLQKVLSILLCLAMVIAWLPGSMFTAEAVSEATKVVDDHTLDQWKLYFGPRTGDPNGVTLSTEYAGGVWTDKSVFPMEEDKIPDQLKNAAYVNGGSTTSISIKDTGDNFLVALSAMASNKEITGYATIPTDTVLILDMSSSMRTNDDWGDSAIDELVDSANKAITELQELNKNNRVAVVLYAGNVNQNFSSANGTTQVILPLDTYKAAANGTYLQAVDVDRNENWGLKVADGVTNSDGRRVTGSKNTATGTFIQDGIYEAMRVLLAADTTIDSGVQAGTDRLPIMVLMTDGEPTLASNDYDGNDQGTDLGNSVMHDFDGNTGTNTHRDTVAFMTMLTAAYARKQVEAHYGDARFYTLAYGEEVTRLDEALSVMDPSQCSNNLNTLWNSFLSDNAVTVYRYNTGSSWRPSYGYYTVQNASSGLARLTAEDKLYVDEYFPAETDADLANAFQAIVNEIIIQSKYYPTYVEKDHDHDGYLTFVDKIGEYMEVVDIEGIVVGDRLFSGAALASQLTEDDQGTVDYPKALGDNMVWSVKERMHIEDTAVARALIEDAYEYGQLSYINDSYFSHYIGWFSDDEGKFVDFWHEGMTPDQIAEVKNAKNATHIIKSYGFLGDTTVLGGVSDTDMMYMSVRVSTEISTGESFLTWQIPASLIPTLTYEVSVNVDEEGNVTEVTGLQMEARTADSPIRLLYEVALQEDIHDWNLTEKVADSYKTSTENKTEGYVFYTNKWTASPEDTTRNTYSHFEPSDDNERYYYTEDTLVYADEQGTVYTGAKPTSGTYYRQYKVYEIVNGRVRTHDHYERITAQSLAMAEAAENNQWVIPKGTIHRYYDFETTEKSDGTQAYNPTGTMAYSDHPFIVKTNENYYTYSTQGNNGKLTVAPATGIKLTKLLTEAVDGASNTFTFTIAGQIAQAQLVRLYADGKEASRTDLPANGQITLTAGETVYIIGLEPGSYTVTESAHDNYSLSSVTVDSVDSGKQAAVTVTDQNINDVIFTNAPKGYGSLIVSKDVNYPEGFVPADAHDDKEFTVAVTFTGDISEMAAPAGAQKNGNVYTLTLKDGDSVTFSNIPEGVTYAVEETGLSAGYSLQEYRYSDNNKTIETNDQDQVRVVNRYAPAPVSPNVEVEGTKTVDGTWPAGESFTVRLWQVMDFASGTIIKTDLTAVVTKDSPDYRIDLSGISLDRTGTFYVRVAEDIPENEEDRIEDMAYDRTLGLFSITVTDTDADGNLEISNVRGYQGTPVTGDATNGWTVTKDFTNVVTKDLVYLDIEKSLTGFTGNNPPVADITFGLFETMTSQSGQNPVYYNLTDGQGKTTLMIPVSASALAGGEAVYYLREIAPAVENRVVGMTYDESWLYAIRISWDSTDNKAVVEYAPIENDVVGTYQAYDRSAVTFQHTNPYTPGVQSTPAINLTGTKTMTGDTTDVGGRTFRFSIYNATAAFVPQGNPIQTVTNNGSDITFNAITFNSAGMKYLVIRENDYTDPSVTEDASEYHVTVLVEKYDDNGTTKLKVADGYPRIVKYGATDAVAPDAIDFVNNYTITGVTAQTIRGTKVLTGRPLLNAEFIFLLTEVADAQGTSSADSLILLAENGPATNGVASFSFPQITYDTPGVYFYKITEEKGNEDLGVTFATNSYIVKVTVTDNGVGGLNSQQEIVSGGAAISFTNSYTPQKEYIGLYSTKELTGRVLNNEEFEFSILQTESDFVTPVSGGLSTTVKNNSNGGITFPQMEFTGNDVRYFLIKEVLPTDGNGQPMTEKDGISYDTSEYLVTVTAVDNQLGRLVVSTDIQKRVQELDEDENPVVSVIPASSVVFNNIYLADPVEAQIGGSKVLTGRDMEADEFTFLLTQVDENGTELENGYTDSVNNTAAEDGEAAAFTFAPVSLNQPGNYYYKITEDKGGTKDKGVRYDDSVFYAVVEVTDLLDGQLFAEVTYYDHAGSPIQAAEFANTYTTEPATYVVSATKQYERPAGEAMKAFTFELSGTGITTQEKKNDESGVVTFDVLTFTQPGTYTLTVSEKQDLLLGLIKWDKNVYTLTLVVEDNNEGELEITGETLTSVKGTDDLVFLNADEELILEKDVFLAGDITTSINGEAVKYGDELIYTITYTNYNRVAADVTVTDKIPQYTKFVSAENGGICSGDEVVWDLGTVPAGQSRTVSFKVVVIDDGGAAVTNEAIVRDSGDEFHSNETFNPLLKTEDVTVDLTVRKNVSTTGTEAVSPKGFSFKLEDLTTQESAVRKSDEEGLVVFSLKFTKEDIGKTYTYKITEVQENKTGWTYDTAEYLITLKVTIGADGKLSIAKSVNEVAADQVSVSFTNVYKPTVTPPTGDRFQLIPIFAAMLCAAMGMVAVLIFRKKRV